MAKDFSLEFLDAGKALYCETESTWSIQEGKLYLKNENNDILGAHVKVTDQLLLIGEEVEFAPLVYFVYKKAVSDSQ